MILITLFINKNVHPIQIILGYAVRQIISTCYVLLKEP
jgi:hypothetical protein